ncbi:hypothetical protein EC957_010494 [Mortierella hygrophila]|uniref:polynucleotide adenylyltransferase n=1 Tax=Mortierella hygrophila TaxID=979708 RepID=A0A9P6F9Q6_9FUNG|nr:hypothetical protein EC957_010494 [Mortierella hygrophila]
MDSHRVPIPHPKATAHTNNNTDQVLFIDALFLLILFDCSGHYEHVDNQLSCVEIAEAFAHVRQIFEYSDPGEFDNDLSVSFIRQHRLDTPEGMMNYLTYHSPHTSAKPPTPTGHQRKYYFPYSIDLHLADDKICGGLGYLSDVEEHHIHVRQFTVAERKMFLRFYAKSIPRSFHNDLAVLTQELRQDVWYRMIQSKDVCCLPNGMEAVKMFTKEYNDCNRVAAGRRLEGEPNQLSPTDQQLKAETWKRKATDGALESKLGDDLGDELDTVLWNDLVSNLRDFNVITDEEAETWKRGDDSGDERDTVLWNGLISNLRDLNVIADEADMYRQHQRQAQETEKLAQRNTTITEYMDKLRATQSATPHRKNEVQAIRQAVERRLREHYRDYGIEVHLFGSFASGLCSMSSDADMTVYNLRMVALHCPPIVELATVLRRIGYQRITSIPNARVPIATWKLYGIQCDANLNQPMGVHNSKLISTYSNIDDRFKTLWFSIKQIGKQHGIISASAGFLSSYALTMLLIVFLQDVTSPTILPRLQQSPLATLHTIDGYDCSFDSQTIYTNYGADNTHSAGQLLIDFFYFYGYVFDYANQEVHPSLGKIQNRSITPPARSRMDRRPKDWPICILDPFITDRNVAGNCGKENVARIQTCFQSAYHALEENDINKAFCV